MSERQRDVRASRSKGRAARSRRNCWPPQGVRVLLLSAREATGRLQAIGGGMIRSDLYF